jgi:general stress protein 26
MKTESNPPANPDDGPDIEDDLCRIARQFVDGRHLGVLTTVDAAGAPHARWMATLTLDAFPRLLTLTAAQSAKVRHIRANPQVNWLFSNDDLTTVLNLHGRARIHIDTVTIKRTWKAIEDKSHPYFLTGLCGKSGIAVIETMIERIDYTAAEAGVRHSHVLALPQPTP